MVLPKFGLLLKTLMNNFLQNNNFTTFKFLAKNIFKMFKNLYAKILFISRAETVETHSSVLSETLKNCQDASPERIQQQFQTNEY